jgi:hypothetical protein
MKTAMEKKETGLMRQIGYLSFVVVLLYGLTLFAVSCDNDEDPPLPPAVEKVVLAFGVDQGEGQLSAIYFYIFKHVFRHSDSACLYIAHMLIC